MCLALILQFTYLQPQPKLPKGLPFLHKQQISNKATGKV